MPPIESITPPLRNLSIEEENNDDNEWKLHRGKQV